MGGCKFEQQLFSSGAADIYTMTVSPELISSGSQQLAPCAFFPDEGYLSTAPSQQDFVDRLAEVRVHDLQHGSEGEALI